MTRERSTLHACLLHCTLPAAACLLLLLTLEEEGVDSEAILLGHEHAGQMCRS